MEKPDSGRSGIPLDRGCTYIGAINFPPRRVPPSPIPPFKSSCVFYSTMSVVITSRRCSLSRLEMKLTKRRSLFLGRVITVLLMYFMRCVRHGGINMIIFGLLRLDVN